jgi:hypothetical protein
VIKRHLERMIAQLVDSSVETTRVFWRIKYLDATDEEARDPRAFEEVLRERHTRKRTTNDARSTSSRGEGG